MSTLSPDRKRIIISRANATHPDKIAEAIITYDNLSLDDFPTLDPKKKEYIQGKLDSLLVEEEQKAWAAVKAKKADFDNSSCSVEDLITVISDYISSWSYRLKSQNHVEESKRMLESLEDIEWGAVDIESKKALLDYLRSHSNTAHKDDIDCLYWELTEKDVVSHENGDYLDDYRLNFPRGKYSGAADNLEMQLGHWLRVKNSHDIFACADFVKVNGSNPFINKARMKLNSLKREELDKMKNSPNSYEVGTLLKFLNENIFSEYELISEGVLTESVLDTLRNADIMDDLPDMQTAIDRSRPECNEGYTDIYFFGVPSTGKTCILMGLSRSQAMHINLAHAGGSYAEALQQYIDAGITVPQTKMGFVATLEGTIKGKDQDTQHKVNLIEMAGEDFARRIAGNEERVFDFESMGTGATELLKNDNRKVFFLIIDPTTNVIRYKRKEVVAYNEETGEPEYDLVTIRINQQTLISKMIDLFAHESNAEIMKKVDAIHIIITKADLLGDNIQREERAIAEFNSKYGEDLVDRLIELSKDYNINTQYNFVPRLYTFSLGKFYVGGIYEYDATDSNKLVKAIRNATGVIKRRSFWDKVKEKFN